MDSNKKKTIIILISTVLLAIIAVFTGFKLYRLRQERISTTKPKAEEVPLYGCGLHFVVSVPPTATPSATLTATPSATLTPIPGCWDECALDDENSCLETLECQEVDEVYRCVNPECPGEEDCQCPEPSATPTPTATPTEVPATETPAEPTATLVPGQPTYTPTPPEALPTVGSIWPTIGVTLGGIILGIIGFLLAL